MADSGQLLQENAPRARLSPALKAAMDPDFSRLYSELGLSPQAGLKDLKRAYRRRVGQLHPDRHPVDSGLPDTQGEFAQLVSLYGMAMRFHRLHGRLPGEAAATSTIGVARDHEYVEAPGSSTALTTKDPMPVKRGWQLLATLALLIVVGYFQAPEHPALAGDASRDAGLSEQGNASAGRASMAPQKLALGMDMDLVMEIQGQPSYRKGDIWGYGPSWLRFERGRLVEWYSSPLYRLSVSTPTALVPVDSPGPGQASGLRNR